MNSDFDVGTLLFNKKNQELRVRTVGDKIMFQIVDGENRAEFEVDYKNKILMEDLKKQFVLCESHASKVHNNELRVGSVDKV